MVSSLLEIAGAESVPAGVAFLLTLGAGMAVLFAVAYMLRLRRDARVIEAAENFEPVSLTTVVQRYVPAEYQTNAVREEMAIAKQVITIQWSRWRRIAAIFGITFVCGATVTIFLTLRYLEAAAAARLAAKPLLNLDVLNYIQGVWGSRANSLESCAENPQILAVAPDRKTLTLRFAKPFKQDSETITNMTFNIVSVKPNMLVLLWTDSPAATKPTTTDVLFVDANTMSWSPSESANVSSGAIERCPPTRRVPASQ
jgi:hypothetical protein